LSVRLAKTRAFLGSKRLLSAEKEEYRADGKRKQRKEVKRKDLERWEEEGSWILWRLKKKGNLSKEMGEVCCRRRYLSRRKIKKKAAESEGRNRSKDAKKRLQESAHWGKRSDSGEGRETGKVWEEETSCHS